MNGTWLAFITLLMVVLIAVAMGAEQIQAQQTQEISQLMDQRKTSVDVAQEAIEQRNTAFQAREEALAKVDGLNAQIAGLQGDLQKASLELQNEHSTAVSRQQEIDRLVKEAGDLQAQMMDLQAKHTALTTQYTQLQQEYLQIPVTKSENSETAASPKFLALQAGNLPKQLGLGLAILIGMAALGSGGYIYYRHDPDRKYAVSMTKEQIREYARYQRERGKQVGS